MNTLALPIFPSCRNCLSWSDDGELAIGAGEFVQVLTPKSTEHEGTCKGVANWHTARFRVNTFTNKEWPLIYSQDRNNFSLGREQSTSHVIDLSWSPPGLAKYRQCLLAVLTANQLLSLYEGVDDKWERVAIINLDLEPVFSDFIHDKALVMRKASVRSFAWCPPFKTQSPNNDTVSSVPDPESRWGLFFLTITNDDNDVICLRVKRSTASNRYSAEMKCLFTLHDLVGIYPEPLPPSLFSTALKSSIRALSISSGPWISNGKPDAGHSATALVSVVYGTKLKVIKLDVTLRQGETETERYTAAADFTEFPTLPLAHMSSHNFTGPFQWVLMESQMVYLVAGVFAGLVAFSLPLNIYTGGNGNKDTIKTEEVAFYEDSIGEMQDQRRHWDPISAMAITLDEQSQKYTLHLGTTGGYTLTKQVPDSGDPVPTAPWRTQFDELRDSFDINHDLGGLAIGRIWGLAANRGMIAVAATLHPGDMVDYRSTANELTNITFSPVSRGEGIPTIHGMPLDRPQADMQASRERVIGFVLHVGQELKDCDTWCKRVVYGAACCAIVESENESLRSQARAALEHLAAVTGADLNDEISKCSASPTPVDAKPAEQLHGAGGEVFEKCEICNSGISWYSAQESQCVAGHLFVRCNLSFLSIQDPGLSKVCSNCGTEYLSEELVEPSRIYGMLSDAFDTCIYCDGKFRD